MGLWGGNGQMIPNLDFKSKEQPHCIGPLKYRKNLFLRPLSQTCVVSKLLTNFLSDSLFPSTDINVQNSALNLLLSQISHTLRILMCVFLSVFVPH